MCRNIPFNCEECDARSVLTIDTRCVASVDRVRKRITYLGWESVRAITTPHRVWSGKRK